MSPVTGAIAHLRRRGFIDLKLVSVKVVNLSPDDAIAFVMTDAPANSEHDYKSLLRQETPGGQSWEWYLASAVQK